MTIIDEGNPAFPAIEHNGDGSVYFSHLGMSLRDWFAGQALIGMGQWVPDYTTDLYLRPNLKSTDGLKARAKWAYAQADAMIAARKL